MRTDDFESDCEVNLNTEIVCRICLETRSPLQNIFIQEIIDGQLIPLPRLFQKVLQIKIIKNDRLPQKICSPCKSKLIEYQKFKAKCESSHKLLHDVLKPGYDFQMDTQIINIKKLPVDQREVECQTDDSSFLIEFKTTESKEPEVSTVEIFQDAIEFYELQTKAIEMIGRLQAEDELYSLCHLYSYFSSGSQCPECAEPILDVAFLHSHMKEKHLELVKNFIEKLNSEESLTEVIVEDEQYDGIETEEMIEIEELEDDCYTIKHELNNEDVTIIVADPQSESYHCPICHKLLRGEEVEKHKLLHRDVLPLLFENIEHYMCHDCHSVFMSIDQVKNHYNSDLNSCSGSVLENVVIDSQVEFESLPEIPQKISVFRKKSELSADSQTDSAQTFVEIEEVQFQDLPATKFICGTCNKGYSNIIGIRYHTFNHLTSYDCPLKECDCKFDFAYKLLGHFKYVHLKDRVDPYLQCPHCKFVLQNKKEYLYHIKTACIKRTISCEQCSKKFFNIAALKNHEKTHEVVLQCEECDLIFERNSDLRNHVKNLHTGEKLHKCSICDKRFRTPSHRLDHEQTHNTENKYQCEYCQLWYKSERVLKAHKKIHSGRSHACPICGKLFNRVYHVKLHMKVHEDKKSKLEDI